MNNDTSLKCGLYEEIINQKLKEEIQQLHSSAIDVRQLDKAEAPKILSRYVSQRLEQRLRILSENSDTDVLDQVALANQMVEQIDGTEESSNSIAIPGEELLAISDPSRSVIRPSSSLADISLFTGGPLEPKMGYELQKEILSSSRVDLLVSFIRWTGIRTLLDSFRTFTDQGGHLRILTTTYTGATDVKAIEELNKLPNTEIRISYDHSKMRLHAKAYLFIRDTGYSTAYVGSSNISDAALFNGREWNMKVTATSQPEVLAKIQATFENYWNSMDFQTYTSAQREKLTQELYQARFPNGSQPAAASYQSYFDITPYPYQQAILDSLKADRVIRRQFKNLVVAATGTGKTVIAAFDYRRFIHDTPKSTHHFLYVAHRTQILEQARETFRGILRDANFGEIDNAVQKPQSFEYVFATIQTLNTGSLYRSLPADYYDYIVVDEFHHASASSYQELLSYFKPKILLGLTATPERSDGKDILSLFNGHISAELRLPEAIDRELLCPFQYFLITDTIDLNRVPWVRGTYDKETLNQLYSQGDSAQKRAQNILDAINRYITDLSAVRGLGFCVSVQHARFMADVFNKVHIPSIALTGSSSPKERVEAHHMLEKGELTFIFSVDLYNEGVDLKFLNTILFLRPTESLTIFLQQLGRGLRLSPDKECLTVLDFVGEANRSFSFEDRIDGLLRNTHHSAIEEVKHGFPSLPSGCTIFMEKVAQNHILSNLKSYFQNRNALVQQIQSFSNSTGQQLTLANFVHYYHLQLRQIYKTACWSRLCSLAEVITDFKEPLEQSFTKGMYDLCQIDSPAWIHFLIQAIPTIASIQFNNLTIVEQRMFSMFYITMFKKSMKDFLDPEVQKNIAFLDQSIVLKKELLDVLQLRLEDLELVGDDPSLPYPCPLEINCSYTRDQLFIALGYNQPQNIREGVKWLPDIQTDVLLVTLNKSEDEYSSTTMYEDYSISPTLFHWQSQTATSDTSPTGQRYIHHDERGSYVLLFARQKKKDDINHANAGIYTFLGPCHYQSHSGSKPMTIIWKLDHAIPAKFLISTSKVLA